MNKCGNVENVDEIINYFDNQQEEIMLDKNGTESQIQKNFEKKQIILKYKCYYLYKESYETIKLYEKAAKEILHCKFKSSINKNFNEIFPNFKHLNKDTTKFFFITIRPKFICEKNVAYRRAFREFIKTIFSQCIWNYGIGCWEICQSGEYDSLHCHIVATLDPGNERAKKNGGKMGVINEIKRVYNLNKNDKFKKIFNLGDSGIDVRPTKGIDNIIPRMKYMSGQKKEKEKEVDIEATRQWRLENKLPALFYLGNIQEIPEELHEA